MKRTRFIISVLVLASIICSAHAIKLCQLDWLESWKNASGQLPNSRRSWSRGNYYDADGNGGAGAWVVTGGIGTWAIASDHGSPGVYHTVSGQSYCSSTNSGIYTDGAPNFDNRIPSNNTNCWCRMISPSLSNSWVFWADYGAASACASSCAVACSGCIYFGTYESCVRSVLLTLPQ
jgi:hypothetical protein